MAFVNLSLLLGGALIAIPVVLHLIMRQKPKQLVFPAVRFIQQRRIANQRRLQLRHWILLALRCAAIGLVALALARPSVASADLSNWLAIGLVGALAAAVVLIGAVALAVRAPKSLVFGLFGGAAAVGLTLAFMVVRSLAGGAPVIGDQEAPVAAVLVVDTSPRMDYRHENRTRLDVARETADWLVRQLPADSEVAVIDSRSGSGAFAVDRAAAAKMIERVRPTGTPRPLPDSIATAVNLARQHEHTRKEVYVFTDLAQAAWNAQSAGELAKLLADHRHVLLYLIDVGVPRPRNFALGDLTLSSDVVPQGGELTLAVEARAVGPGGAKTVELELEQSDPTLPIIRDGKPVLPKSVRRGSHDVQLADSSAERIEFVLRNLDPGVHQGLVRLIGEDGLALDDVRYFAIEVQEAWPVLVVAPPEVPTTYFVEAIAPREFRDTGRARFACETIDQSRLAQTDLNEYQAVVLLDPTPLPPELWEKLGEYAAEGGGLGIFLGHNAQPLASFQDPAAIGVLGGKLTRQTRSGGDLFIAPRSFDHPITAAFRQIETSVPWDRFPIRYHWNLDELAQGARTIIPFGNNKPALVEHRVGRGRVLTMTTPVSDPPRPVGYDAWNRLATGEDAWPYLVLVNETMLHLVGSGQSRLNLQAGETAVLLNDEGRYPARYQLFSPLEQPQDLSARDGRLTVRFTDNPGAYRLRGQLGGPIVRGFAVNLAEETSDLARLPVERLDELLGKGRYQLAGSKEEINRAVGNDRVGSEFYPLLFTLVAIVLGLEHVLGNRFYKKDA